MIEVRLTTTEHIRDEAAMDLWMLKREPLSILLRARSYVRLRREYATAAIFTGVMLNEFVELVNWWRDVA
jgi:hypothetical protein